MVFLLACGASLQDVRNNIRTAVQIINAVSTILSMVAGPEDGSDAVSSAIEDIMAAKDALYTLDKQMDNYEAETDPAKKQKRLKGMIEQVILIKDYLQSAVVNLEESGVETPPEIQMAFDYLDLLLDTLKDLQ